ncbi:alpha-1A adrenergic receptor-like [Antedon mediterranea]|uniref:alpha-1A adrenergic receptor-like n=1 Tax=Antedon mediterranea TaxID=105859 RepID=UPI003AF5A00F
MNRNVRVDRRHSVNFFKCRFAFFGIPFPPVMMVKPLNSTTAPNSTFYEVDAGMICKIVGLLSVNVLIVIGNILILLAVTTDKSLRTVTSYFIVNLAVADLLLGVIVIPFAGSYQIMGQWVFGENFCLIWAATDVLCCTASIYGLCCIGIDRYIGVTIPLKHHLIMTKKKALFTIGISWMCSFAVASGPLFGWRPTLDDPNQCPMSDSVDYVLFSTSCSFYIPLVIVLIIYYRIYREVAIQNEGLKAGYKTSVITSEGANTVTLRIHVSISANHKAAAKLSFSQKVATFNRQKRAAKTLGLVIGGFIVCWFPFFFVFPFSKICASCVSVTVFQTCVWLGYCNSFLNPFIYAYSNKAFRNAFRRLLTCRCSKASRQQRDLRYLSNINRYTSVSGTDSPIISPAKCRNHNNNMNNNVQLEPIASSRKMSRRRRGIDERRDNNILQDILEQEIDRSLTDEQDHHKSRNTNQEEFSKNIVLRNASVSDNIDCSDDDDDDECSFINNLQNMDRFFEESTRIYNHFLQTRSSKPLKQCGRRPSAPSTHISVFVETIDDSKITRRGSYFV